MEALDLSSNIRYLPARNEVKHAYSDHSKAMKVFERESTTSLENGVKKMVNWVKKVGVRETKNFDNIEIMEKLPSVWLEE